MLFKLALDISSIVSLELGELLEVVPQGSAMSSAYELRRQLFGVLRVGLAVLLKRQD